MENKQIDTKVAQAFEAATPDILDKILSKCDEEKEGSIIKMTQRKKNPVVKWVAGIAAAFVLFVGGTAGINMYQSNNVIASKVSIDVNPSIEIQVNEKGNVLEVVPRNEDAEIIVGEMEFKGSSMEVTVNALVGSMLRHGYLNEIANSILISVEGSNDNVNVELQEKVAKEIETVLEAQEFYAAVLSQTLTADEELESLAETYDVSVGKASLIRDITEQNTDYSFEELASLSINELNVLTSAVGMELSNVVSSGIASTAAYIEEAKAEDIAVASALNAIMQSITGPENMPVPDEVQPTVSPAPGELPEVTDIPEAPVAPEPTGMPDVPAIPDFGENVLGSLEGMFDWISNVKCKMSFVKGKMVYVVEFEMGGQTYTYTVNAMTGEVLKDMVPAQNQGNAGNRPGTNMPEENWNGNMPENDNIPDMPGNNNENGNKPGTIPEFPDNMDEGGLGEILDGITGMIPEIEENIKDILPEITPGAEITPSVERPESEKPGMVRPEPGNNGNGNGNGWGNIWNNGNGNSWFDREGLKKIIFEHLGIDADPSIEFSYDVKYSKEGLIAEVEFSYNDTKYEYKIDVLKGTVLESVSNPLDEEDAENGANSEVENKEDNKFPWKDWNNWENGNIFGDLTEALGGKGNDNRAGEQINNVGNENKNKGNR